MTPIQQAIEYVESEMAKWRRDDSIDAPIYTAYELTRNHLQSLLPKEKEFVGMVWDASAERATNVFTQTFHPEHFPDKIDFLNQLYPEK